jgi:hypothetical protein
MLSAQVITYNKNIIFSNESIEESCAGVVEVNGRQFIAGNIGLSDGERIGVAEIDSTGNKIWNYIIGDSVNNFGLDGYNGLNRTSDGHLILTGIYRNLLDSTRFNARTFLIKMTSEGELVWIKIINDSIFPKVWTFGVQVIETSDHGFAIIGQISIKGIVYKTDSLGNVQWYKPFRSGYTSLYEYFSSIEELPDSGFLIGSHEDYAGDWQSGDALVYRLSSTGGIVWSKLIGGQYPDGNGAALLLNDSVVMILAPYTTKAAPVYYSEQEIKLRILKLKLTSGAILSDTMYGDNDKLYIIKQVRRLKDGTFIACGGDLYARLAWLFNFNEDGDSLFLRDYSYAPSRNRYDPLKDFNGCIVCNDGGILAVGTYDPSNASNSHWNGWIVKTDRYGCFEMACDSNAIYILDHPDTTTQCRNQSAEMAITTFGKNCNFQWQVFHDSSWTDVADTNIYHGIDSTSLLIKLSGMDLHNYWYRCKVYNNKYVAYSDSAGLIIKDTVSFLYQPQDQFIRKQDSALFIVIAGGEEPITYQWYRNGEPVQNSFNDSLIIYSVSPSDTGIYFCRVINPCGPEDSHFTKLTINYTSVDLLKKDPVIQYYPNPAEEYIMVGIKTCEKSDISLRLLDLSGRILSGRNLAGAKIHSEKIDLSTLHPGLYFLEIRIGEEIYRKKIIKSN